MKKTFIRRAASALIAIMMVTMPIPSGSFNIETDLATAEAAGTVIGTVGNTGLNKSGQSGKHLHIDMNCVPSYTGSVIRNSPNRIINPIDLYSYSFTGTVY